MDKQTYQKVLDRRLIGLNSQGRLFQIGPQQLSPLKHLTVGEALATLNVLSSQKEWSVDMVTYSEEQKEYLKSLTCLDQILSEGMFVALNPDGRIGVLWV